MPSDELIPRILLAIAGVLGAAGIAAAAAASHTGGEKQMIDALILVALTQAPAVLALALLAKTRLLRLGGLAIGLGAVLFSADLAVRHFLGWERLLPFAAPAGGIVIIAGWLAIVATALAGRR
jgi:uncharacterized membrane protein YgdD (TMEM256/DUF423 family)